MTIIEDAVRRLEKVRAAKRKAETDRLGTVVEVPESESGAVAPEAAESRPSGPNGATGAEASPAETAAAITVTEPSADAGRAPRPHDRRILIRVDRAALREAGLMPPEDDESRMVDEFRHIKRPIVAHALGRRATKIEDGRLIMVASALAGEGKTFTCLNLALSMARERDISLVLVDADVAKPHISRVFGVENEPGLLDLLEEPEAYDYRELVIETDVSGLGLLPAGRPRANATELLASDRMEELLRAYRKDNSQRLVLFDSPPLLQTPEAHVLADLAGQIVLVVRADSTPKHVVLDAIASIDESKAVNLVLNQARFGGPASYYGGYHGYGYGYGYGRRAEPEGTDSSAG